MTWSQGLIRCVEELNTWNNGPKTLQTTRNGKVSKKNIEILKAKIAEREAKHEPGFKTALEFVVRDLEKIIDRTNDMVTDFNLVFKDIKIEAAKDLNEKKVQSKFHAD